LSTKKLTTPFN